MDNRYLVVLRYTYEEEEQGKYCHYPYKMYPTISKAIAGGKAIIEKEKTEPDGFTSFEVYQMRKKTGTFEWIYWDCF